MRHIAARMDEGHPHRPVGYLLPDPRMDLAEDVHKLRH